MSWTAEEDAAFRQEVDGARPSPLRAVPAPLAGESWEPIELSAIVAGVQAGEIVGPVPSAMSRSDGVCLLYPGETAQLAGEPESGKGWIALSVVVAEIGRGAAVLYLDFEDAAPSIVSRLLALGAEAGAIVDRFAYVRPVDPFDAERFHAVAHGRPYALAVIDGVSEAYALLGLELNDNGDAARFLSAIPRPIADTGAAVLLIDHVPKAKDGRGRYALGAQHKLAGIATAYSTEVVTAPSRQAPGLVKLRVEKDRHGHVRGHASGGVIALVRIVPTDDGERISVSLDPPEKTTDDTGEFRPTTLMARISRFLESDPGATARTIRSGVSGKDAYIDQGLRVLVDEGYVDRRPDGQANRHYSVREYREDTDRGPVAQPWPNRGPDTVNPTVAPWPPLIGPRDTGHGPVENDTASRDTVQP